MEEELEKISRQYNQFADYEARGKSSIYYRLAKECAGNVEILEFLKTLPKRKRQPNLLFAVCRFLYGVPESGTDIENLVKANTGLIRAELMSRSTQTNEPARCAGIYLALSGLQSPVALIEVGASAGLCLLPDRYRYRFNGVDGSPVSARPSAPEFECKISGKLPTLNRDIKISRRIGVDLDPVSVNDADQIRWLETLIWPEQEGRLTNFRLALEEARDVPLHMVKAHLNDVLEDVVRQIAADFPVVVYHSAVMNYLHADEVKAFRKLVGSIGAHWLSQEDSRIFPDFIPAHVDVPTGRFALILDGRLLAHTDPHGGDISWVSET